MTPAFSFKNVNWHSKFQSIIFMSLSGLVTNMPFIVDWVSKNTNRDMKIVTGVSMLLGYIIKTYVMPTQAKIDDPIVEE